MKLQTLVKKIVSLSALSALLASVLLSCNIMGIGLGEEVDLLAPRVALTSHQDNDTIASNFVLVGTASDNENLYRITIDFEDADIHYQISPSGGGEWQKRTSTTGWTTAPYSSCVSTGQGTYRWAVYVDVTDRAASKTDNNYTFTIIAEDKMGNSDKDSKVDCTLVIDTELPVVSIYKPDLFTDDYSQIQTTVEGYSLKDGNVISRLLNGDIVLSGRQSGSMQFKELRIDLDNGTGAIGDKKNSKNDLTTAMANGLPEHPTADEVAEIVTLDGDDAASKHYYSKTIKSGEGGLADLRTWTMTLKQSDWISDTENPELSSGKHIIRIVSTSVSNASAWTRQVIGYFVWWPEADEPWIVTYAGDNTDKGDDAYAVYPSSKFSGTAQDDDGIQSLTYTLEQKDSDGNWALYKSDSLGLSEQGAKYSAWSVVAPAENGMYRLTVTVTDLYGTKAEVVKYFRTMDISPPKIEITSPENGSSVLARSDANIVFKGNVSDDGTIKSFCVVFLNPAKSNDPSNKIAYMSGTDNDAAPWSRATTSGYTDDNGNVIYKIDIGTATYSEEKKANVYNFTKTFNLFTDLKVDGVTRTLEAPDFVFRAEDNGGTNTVQTFSLTGDTETPVITIKKLELYNASGTRLQSYDFDTTETPNLPVIKNGYYARISGTWSDNSTTIWNSTYKQKIGDLTVSWAGNDLTASKGANSWTAEVPTTKLPTTSGVITATIADYAGNTKTASKSVFIETAEAGLERITSDSDDGSYGAGKEILISLEFSKSTTVSSTTAPTLSLNSGGTAYYESGDTTSKHVFKYTVGAGDKNVDNLEVTAINTNGAIWRDTSSGAPLTIDYDAITASNRIGSTRNIRIDTVAPTVKSVRAITSAGSYKENASIILMMEFSEGVTIENVSNLALTFDHTQSNGTDAKTQSASTSGSKYVLFTYTVAAGENTSQLKLKDLVTTSVTATDEAGNVLTAWELPNTALNNKIIIDTTAPVAPTVTAAWGTEKIVFDESGTYFTITEGVESGATVEYTIDGSSWQTYKNQVNLKNNGTYTVKARQTDVAGNVSAESDAITVTVDKGELLTRISANTINGTYSTSTNTKAVEGTITFRKAVSLQSGAVVTLNVGNKNDKTTEKKVAITGAGSGSASSYTFTYTITDGDYITSDDGLLDVISWGDSESDTDGKLTITLDTTSLEKAIPAASENSGKRFNENREINILTGVPTVEKVELAGKGTAAVLTVTFDREINKMSGNITFTQSETDYRVPGVLSESEYNDVLNSYKDLGNYYTAGVNGATLSGSTLTNDTTTKYILNFGVDNTDSTLVGAFRNSAKKHIVSIPIVASAVTVSGKVLTVKLGSTYKLPVMGATYTLNIPAAAVVDAVQNKNTVYTTDGTTTKPHLVAEGVEAPTIRIQKESQTITSSGTTANSTVTMPEQAKMRIDCQTPGTTIYYGKNSKEVSTSAYVNRSPQYFTTRTAEATVPTSYSKYATIETLGDTGLSYSASSNNAKGLKIAIAAYAQTANGTKSATAYEYATRTVLKFKVTGNSDSKGSDTTTITEGGNTLTFANLKVWVIGGDAPYGGNTISPFPLSWNESSSFKLMKGSWTNTGDLQGYWYWVSWDISAPTYHGFVIGDVPSDANEKGPTEWYAGECAWVAQKENYVLYPGESLEMVIENAGSYQAKFLFRLKNKGVR